MGYSFATVKRWGGGSFEVQSDSVVPVSHPVGTSFPMITCSMSDLHQHSAYICMSLAQLVVVVHTLIRLLQPTLTYVYLEIQDGKV